jgi:hypothetical protein
VSDVRFEFAGSWPPVADTPAPHVFGLAEDGHGGLVRVQVQAVVHGPFGLPFRISPEATVQNGRALGELAWTALGAEHVRRA